MSFVRSFLTRWDFDVNDQPLENMEKKLSLAAGRMQNLEKATEQLNKAAADMARVLAVAGAALTASIASLFAVTKSTAEFGNELAKTSQKIGITVEDLQKLRYAADLSDVSIENLDTGLKFLSKNMQEASDGTGTQAEAFRALGVSVANADGSLRDVDDTLLDIADRFADMPDGPLKTARALEIFGRSGQMLIPLLNEGRDGIAALAAEAESFGGILSTSTAKASEQFLDDMTRIRFIVTSLKNALGSALMPIFQGFITDTLEWARANRELIKTKVEQWAGKIGSALQTLWKAASVGFKILDGIVRIFGGWEFVAKSLFTALSLFGAAKILIALNALRNAFAFFIATKTIASLAKLRTAILWIHLEIQTLTVKTLAAQAAALAIPIAIAAAVAAVGLLIEDIITFFQGGESAFGKFLKMIQDNLDWIERAFIDVGTTIIEFWLTPLRSVIELLNTIFKDITGIDALGGIGIKTGEAGEKQRAELAKAGLGGAFRFATSPIRDLNLDERGIMRPDGVPVQPTQPSIRPLPAARRSADQAAITVQTRPMNLENNVTVNASGLTQDQASQAIADALKKSNDDFLRKSGQKSFPRNKE